MAKVKSYRGIGGVYKVGQWYYARWTINGKKHTVPTHCTNKEKALEFLAKETHAYTYESRRGQLEHIKTEISMMDKTEEEYQQYANRIELKNLKEEVFKSKNMSENVGGTRNVYSTTIKYFVEWIDENKNHIKHMGEVDKKVVEEYLDWVKEVHGVGAKNRAVVFLGACWNALKSKAHLTSNPWKEGFGVEKVEESPKQNLTRDEFKRLEEVCRKNKQDWIIFRISTLTAMRLSDACLFKWSWISPDWKLISFVPHKLRRFGKKITIPMTAQLKELLDEIPKGESDYIQPHMAKIYNSRSIVPHTRKLFKKANIEMKNEKGVTVKSWHSLRVWAISTMLESGIPLATVQSIAGHIDSDMTQHYYRMDLDKTRKAIEGLNVSATGIETVTIPKDEYDKLLSIKMAYEDLVKSGKVDVDSVPW